ncbi:Dam family site-specific DNA-(adenine-N6)-methyltransferase [Leptolyngbya sp. FACHB-16]|uniref:DNA adenine methylase n=1 Tax=unclassified Leptolyngbya TaxID=2650499 RepID=UPI001689DB2A|nr:Dam family site-specific DNA-(adenine-N6)-methyltransferase [Leptolyngbya sp. FACHB-16]MBD2153129.1 Dam family site-specific DNA-(adenine-N6)-methyltransferase [Leptolyngbya sp. FACHB-16]
MKSVVTSDSHVIFDRSLHPGSAVHLGESWLEHCNDSVGGGTTPDTPLCVRTPGDVPGVLETVFSVADETLVSDSRGDSPAGDVPGKMVEAIAPSIPSESPLEPDWQQQILNWHRLGYEGKCTEAEMEEAIADIIWEHAPIKPGQRVKEDNNNPAWPEAHKMPALIWYGELLTYEPVVGMGFRSLSAKVLWDKKIDGEQVVAQTVIENLRVCGPAPTRSKSPDTSGSGNSVNGCPFHVGDRVRVKSIHKLNRNIWNRETQVVEVTKAELVIIQLDGDRRWPIPVHQLELVNVTPTVNETLVDPIAEIEAALAGLSAATESETVLGESETVTPPKRDKKQKPRQRKAPKCPEFTWQFEDEPQPGDRVWYATPTNQAIVQRVEGNTVHVVWEDDGELGTIPNLGNKARGYAEFWYGNWVWHEDRANTGMVQEVLDYGRALVEFDSGEVKEVSQCRLHPVYPSEEAKKQAKKPRKEKLFKAPNPAPVLGESEAIAPSIPKVINRDLVSSLKGVKERFDANKARAEVAESFIKWPGGKRRSRQARIWQVLDRVWANFSCASRTLIEPFCGAGNVALGLRAEKAVLGDANPHIINLWQQVQCDGLPITLSMRNERECYEAIRDSFNAAIADGNINTPDAAQQFLYLVKTGFNGLVRFNRSGGFNVPFGKHKTLTYPKDLKPYQNISKSWQFICQDWRETLKLATADSFVYSDCPYDKFDGPEQLPLLGEEYRAEGNGFVSYTSGGFPWPEQVALARALAELPCPVVASNAATPRILELYRGLGFEVQIVQAKRSISCNGDRTDAAEMIAVKLPSPLEQEISSKTAKARFKQRRKYAESVCQKLGFEVDINAVSKTEISVLEQPKVSVADFGDGPLKPVSENDWAESLHDELAQLEMKRDALFRDGELAPQGAWLETGKVKGKEFRQAWWRSSKPMFTPARSKGNAEALIKSSYIGKEGGAEHKAAIAAYQRRKEYNRLTRLIEKLEAHIQ